MPKTPTVKTRTPVHSARLIPPATPIGPRIEIVIERSVAGAIRVFSSDPTVKATVTYDQIGVDKARARGLTLIRS